MRNSRDIVKIRYKMQHESHGPIPTPTITTAGACETPGYRWRQWRRFDIDSGSDHKTAVFHTAVANVIDGMEKPARRGLQCLTHHIHHWVASHSSGIENSQFRIFMLISIYLFFFSPRRRIVMEDGFPRAWCDEMRNQQQKRCRAVRHSLEGLHAPPVSGKKAPSLNKRKLFRRAWRITSATKLAKIKKV